MNIYVGNLPYKTDNDTLRQLFEQFGKVDTVDIIVDRRTGRSRGYGFVTMPDDGEGNRAVDNLNGHELEGRNLRVDISKPKSEKDAVRTQRPARQSNRSESTSHTSTPKQSGGIFSVFKRLFGK